MNNNKRYIDCGSLTVTVLEFRAFSQVSDHRSNQWFTGFPLVVGWSYRIKWGWWALIIWYSCYITENRVWYLREIRSAVQSVREWAKSGEMNLITKKFFISIVCPWLNFGLPPRCPQVVWCHWREIEPFSATLAQDGLAECDQPGKNLLEYTAMAGNWTRAMGKTDGELFHWAITKILSYIK